MMDEVVLKFQGFHPSDFTRALLNDVAEEIRREAPTGATVRASFVRKDGVFKGTVEAHSHAGSFFAQSSGPRLLVVARRLLEQMRRKIGKWESTRMARRRSLRDVPTGSWGPESDEYTL